MKMKQLSGSVREKLNKTRFGAAEAVFLFTMI